MVKESETTTPITNMGVQTLGNVATNMFRNECIFTGCIPVGLAIPNYTEIKIKVPKFKQKLRIGDQWRLLVFYRSQNSASVSTTSMRVVMSCMYKSYS